MCTAGYMNSSAYAICSSAKPCQSGFFCTFEYGGGEGLCLSCGIVPTTYPTGARCCSAASSFFNWGTVEPWVKDGFLSKENLQKCYAACSGTEPGLPGSSCGSGGGSGSGSGYYSSPSYYSTPSPSSSPSRQGSQIVHLASSYYNPHTTQYYIRLSFTDYISVLILLYSSS
jgi:hypothetical protein